MSDEKNLETKEKNEWNRTIKGRKRRKER